MARASTARSTTSSTATAGTRPAAKRNALPGRLSPGMACDTAFRIIARRHLDAVLAQHDATCRGDPDALHQIRIALTHLRTAIRFFSPMVDDTVRPNVWAELKWLNSQLGLVRDLDVAIERVVAASGNELALIAELQSWDEKRAESHRLLARALQSARYRRLIEQTSGWIESGPWSTRRSKEAIRQRRGALADYAAAQLADWERALLKKARRLGKLGVEKRHKLRILNKRMTYSIESLEDLFTESSLARQKSTVKQLRKAQRSLGQLNDDARGQALADSLNGAGSDGGVRFLDRKRHKRLLRTAKAAYRKLDKDKPFRPSDLARSPEADD
ncbi:MULTISPECIES: CHAD domain-containing protein [unclassified Bradyrhizobium]|uniref:CHAD domain-containing protein n=1 Tax=unclassified Bradyrhizobium TaxID=2631580 RepID=UPI00247AFEA8|nr:MULTISPECIES: CHAD domain-containing protein [unclassified Bradyrhizobium]WGR73715.1 CHAD domain-containing protein [Bradyrhizobium sp. ISRA426]WGR78553.1 CHAD domain-containing protein [Bradyrhizobium sp. ISRA430]WGR88954.1 CHAD domain-containing protein [Bradyrhizobium sp. ISRA432]